MSILAAKTNEPIPGYRVIQRIGAGGYGEVWTAQAPGDLKKAIKFVYGLLDEDRAARELKALNRIKGVRHPFLLSLERIEVVDGQLVIVTELADGSLKDRFDEYRKKGLPGIPREELLSHMRDAADALDYMSDQHSLQHLDVKPENLLLLGGRIKVADFGLVKDIHDHTASLMGGLTPVYAPPEVFEGRPSRKSDQYSLAIVYQEMLTGVLPFPGRTAAQLAAQHLNAKPRLSSLPVNDQASIARALSKKPAERYASCRELIDELADIGKRTGSPSGASPAARQPDVDNRSISSATSGATQAGNVTSAGGSDASQAATAPRTPDQMLAHLDEASRLAASAATGAFPGATSPRMTHATGGGGILPDMTAVTDSGDSYEPPPSLADLGDPPPLVDLPPVEADRITWQPRPTLFLGIGGTGSRVLARLKQRLNDRLDESMLPLFPLLALDSDARDLANLTHAAGSTLRSDETVSLPLRRTQDYRNDSRKLLEWLSRRWLYNIPRTQLTEGMRPLGRLALVDHAEQAFGRIRAALNALRTQNESSTVAPRVVIVSSVAGGTGGGMLTDVAYAARQILDQLGMHEAEVLAVLTHATNRNPQQQELAAVNTLATLTEVHQFHRGTTSFPGDPACGLKARAADSPALSGAYLVHLGEELTNEQFDAACDRVAEFLTVDTVTPAAPSLEAARRESHEPGLLNLRTFGLCQIGFAQDRLVEHAVKRVSRSVVERWLGESKRPETKKNVKLLAAGEEAPKTPAEPSQHSAADAKAVMLVQQFRLDLEPLMQVVQQLAADEMGGNPDQYFSGFLQPSAKRNEPDIDRWLGVINDIFGRRVEEGATPPPPKLLLALESRITQLVRHMGSSMRQQIEVLVDDPALRVRGAQRVTKTIQGHLRGLCDKLRDARTRLARESLALEHQLHSSRPDAKAKSKGPRRSPSELQQLFLQSCRVRLLEMTAQIAGQIAHSLQSHVVGSHDALIDLARDLHFLAVQLATDELLEDQNLADDDLPAEERPLPDGDSLAPLRSAVAEQLRQADDALAQQLDQELSASALAAAGGLRGAILVGGTERDALLVKLHTAARLAVLKKLASIDIAGSTLAAKEGDHPLRRLLADCQSWFQPCGGKRRLLCLVPQSVGHTLTPAAMAAQIGTDAFSQLPAIIPDSAGDVVLLYEIGELSIRHAAGAVIYQRPDLADLATRLHTRNDITWTPLLG